MVDAAGQVGMANDRLWGALARPMRRPEPPRGLDQPARRLAGILARKKATAALRLRAQRIVNDAQKLGDQSEVQLDEYILSVRQDVRVNQHDMQTVDRAFAAIHEVVRRQLGMQLYVEQVMGGLVMAAGRCAEMATGEGKTITAILPAALLGWHGQGVHVITVNDYLAQRDAHITSPAYQRLNLSVGVIQEESESHERRHAYACDITHAADKQVVFDWLRDRLCAPLTPTLVGHVLDQIEQIDQPGQNQSWGQLLVQRGLCAAIVDEADSVLIDDAVTPAIIGQDIEVDESDPDNMRSCYRIAGQIAQTLSEDGHYAVDRKLRRITLTEQGKEQLGELAEQLPAFWAGPRRRQELIEQALTARELYILGEDYVISDDEVVIVDRSTGRMLAGRQWQLGLHQAVEVKEGLDAASERRTTTRISFQRFFQQYQHLCGMTGTAWEVASEMYETYDLAVTRVPTHRPMIRKHMPDTIHLTEQDKHAAVLSRVCAVHETSQPVLVGTWSVNDSEALAKALEDAGVACRVLNALRADEEADIIAQAGRRGAVTVATNMAGRGTDILLGEGVRELGGLAVIATAHHDERRVDRQLFGRAGRQGDPGRAEIFVALDDSIVQRFGFGILKQACCWSITTTGSDSRLTRIIGSLLFGSAQRLAGGRARVMRTSASRADAQLELSLHHVSR